tara:strand:- start:375 stop:1034 length:660 start_codon:yes stop_codon:yes gene_type:complete
MSSDPKKKPTKSKTKKVDKVVDKDKKPKKIVKEEKVLVKEEVITPPVESLTETTTELNDTTLTTENTVSETIETKKDTISDTLSNLINKFDSLEKDSKQAKNDLRKVLKLYQKKSFKNKRKYDPNRQPSGFAKPSLISEALCHFLNKPVGTKMARTDVTKEVNNYIKEHNLQNPENKKKIKPDQTLQDLLKITEDDSLTYFSMQKYLKDHFPKEEVSPA